MKLRLSSSQFCLSIDMTIAKSTKRRDKIDLGELHQLSTPLICRLLNAQHELVDGRLRGMFKEILWARLGISIAKWPPWYRRNQNHEGPPWAKTLGYGHIVTYCRDGEGFADPKHRPRRLLVCKAAALHEIDCSCGKRWYILDLKRQQRMANALVWPVKFVKGVAYYWICHSAKGLSDPFHAPDATGTRCICGWTLDERYLPDSHYNQRILVEGEKQAPHEG
jgi:hypothetical protein